MSFPRPIQPYHFQAILNWWDGTFKFVRLLLHIFWRRLSSFADFFTQCGVPLAGESYWSSKRRRYAAGTHLQILQPMGNKRPLSLWIKISSLRKTFENYSQVFLWPRSSCSSTRAYYLMRLSLYLKLTDRPSYITKKRMKHCDGELFSGD